MTVALADLVHDVPVPGPTAIAVTLTTSFVQVLGRDPMRRAVIFYNPGPGIVRVSSEGEPADIGIGGNLIFPQDQLAMYGDEPYSNITAAWTAVTDGGTNPLTIFNFTDSGGGTGSFVPVGPRAPLPIIRQSFEVPIPSPAATVVTGLTASSQRVIGPNQVRRGLLFHNPNDEPVMICVCPANLPASAGAGSIGILPGGERRIIARNRIRVSCAWNAVAALVPNATQPAVLPVSNRLTILEFL